MLGNTPQNRAQRQTIEHVEVDGKEGVTGGHLGVMGSVDAALGTM
jgi:hypothetical protein